MARSLDIGVDLDGVCYDFSAALRRWLQGRGRPPGSMPPPTRWDFYTEQWGMSLPEFLAACNEATDAGFLFADGAPEPGTVMTLRRFADSGHRVHIITDRMFGKGGSAEANTRRWLAAHRIPFSSLTFSPDKTVVRVDTAIDDKPGNYEALDAVGHLPYLRSRPWNEGHPARRVGSWAEFEAVVDCLAWEGR
jgi:hypothetical protein